MQNSKDRTHTEGKGKNNFRAQGLQHKYPRLHIVSRKNNNNLRVNIWCLKRRFQICTYRTTKKYILLCTALSAISRVAVQIIVQLPFGEAMRVCALHIKQIFPPIHNTWSSTSVSAPMASRETSSAVTNYETEIHIASTGCDLTVMAMMACNADRNEHEGKTYASQHTGYSQAKKEKKRWLRYILQSSNAPQL